MSVQPRRMRLKPWLLAQVNSGRFPGLQWIDPQQSLFQIPWRHATRHTPTSEEENTVFKAWAVETGKYQEGVDEADPAKWKANLRCALNKSREFQLQYDGTKETPVHPFKFYRVSQDGTAAHVTGGVDDEDDGDDVEEVKKKTGSDAKLDGTQHCRMGDVAPFSQFSGDTVRPHHVIHMPLLPVTSDVQAAGQTFVPGPSPAAPGLDLMETCSMEGIQNQQPCDLLNSVPLTDLDLKFQYRGRTMDSLTVSNPQGCRLYFGQFKPTPEQVDLFGPVTLQQVCFPGTSSIQNQKQKSYTEDLLDVMDRGLILEIWEQDIYAVRLCQCKVFWSGPGTTEQGPPNPMEREKKIKVFSLNNFLQGLILFHRGEAPNPPPFEVYFCFGEDWPDTKPKEKKLIVVQVVPVVARILTEMFSGELSWSTDSIRLQISNPDVKDQTVQQFKELQKIMQSQQIQGPWTLNMS